MNFTMPPVGEYITEVVRVKELLAMVFKTRAWYQNRAKVRVRYRFRFSFCEDLNYEDEAFNVVTWFAQSYGFHHAPCPGVYN